MAEEITNTKYVTFNAEEFEAWRDASGRWWMHVIRPQLTGHDDQDPPLVPDALEDAVIIRRRDVFAGPGLHAYSMAIQTAIDLVDILGTEPLTSYEVEMLEALRDFFGTQAQLAIETTLKHLPD